MFGLTQMVGETLLNIRLFIKAKSLLIKERLSSKEQFSKSFKVPWVHKEKKPKPEGPPLICFFFVPPSCWWFCRENSGSFLRFRSLSRTFQNSVLAHKQNESRRRKRFFKTNETKIGLTWYFNRLHPHIS